MISLEQIIVEQFKRYPELKARDVYKFIYQAAMGNGHLIKNEKAFYGNLCKEIETIDADPGMPLIEWLDPNGLLLRLNLGPFKATHGNLNKLRQCVIKTASDFQPSLDNLMNYWDIVISLSKETKISLKTSELNKFYKKMDIQSFPATRHSEEYRRLYHPSYRIINHKFLKTLNLNRDLKD